MAAAFVNGVMTAVLEFDDTHIESFIHPTAPVVAVAFPGEVVAAVTDRTVLARELLEPDGVKQIAGAVKDDARGVEIDAVAAARKLREEALRGRHVPANAESDAGQPTAASFLRQTDA